MDQIFEQKQWSQYQQCQPEDRQAWIWQKVFSKAGAQLDVKKI